MQLAFSTNAFRRYSIADAIAAIAAAGYDGVEIMADTPHAWPPHTGPDRTAAIRDALRANGVAAANVNAFMMCEIGDFWHPSWIEPDPARRRLRVEHTRRCVEIAAAVGAPCLSTEPGGPLDGMNAGEALAIFEEGLREILPAAQAAGVKILIEPEPGLLIENSSQMLEFVERMASPHVGVNFDVGHFFCVGEDPARAFERLARWVGHVHVEDIAADCKHYHLVPGRGAIDFGAFFAAARENGYQGWVTVELYTCEDRPEEALGEAKKFLDAFV